MKAEELRIGNLITNGKDIIEVKIISNNGFAAMVNYMPLEDYDYRPITITEEWLLKFGFEETYWQESGKFAHWRKEQISWFDKDLKCIIWYKIRDIIYVHQLQNLYFALTGKELTL